MTAWSHLIPHSRPLHLPGAPIGVQPGVWQLPLLLALNALLKHAEAISDAVAESGGEKRGRRGQGEALSVKLFAGTATCSRTDVGKTWLHPEAASSVEMLPSRNSRPASLLSSVRLGITLPSEQCTLPSRVPPILASTLPPVRLCTSFPTRLRFSPPSEQSSHLLLPSPPPSPPRREGQCGQ